MALRRSVALTAVLLLAAAGTAAGDDAGPVLAKQKQTAEANLKVLQVAPVARAESPSFLLFGSIPEARLKGLAATLDKHYLTALKGLQFGKDEKPWTGKLAVYVFTDRGQLRSFIRQVEKRSPDDAELATASVTGDTPHLAIGPGQGKDTVTLETQAGYQVAAAVLSARARGAPLPEWLTLGFERATAAQAANTAAGVRKRVPRQLAGRYKAADAWNDTLSLDQRLPLATAVADFLFYARGIAKPGSFLVAFRPDDEKPTKTTADALEAVNLTPEQFEVAYLKWLRANN
jgi:hypothetical protein